MSKIRADGTFEVVSFDAVEVPVAGAITTAMETGLATMDKRYAGDVQGRSATLFTSSRNADTGAASYVALEAFQGSINGLPGSFNFTHAASTHGADRYGEFFTIVDASGTGGLAGISGSGGMTVDDDGTHRVWFDYSLDG
jgi:hypothetical protein